jgi:hypothetical protein
MIRSLCIIVLVAYGISYYRYLHFLSLFMHIYMIFGYKGPFIGIQILGGRKTPFRFFFVSGAFRTSINLGENTKEVLHHDIGITRGEPRVPGRPMWHGPTGRPRHQVIPAPLALSPPLLYMRASVSPEKLSHIFPRFIKAATKVKVLSYS